MLRHIVLFNFKPEIKDGDRQEMLGRIRGLSTIGSVRRLSVGSLFEPSNAAYRSHMSSDYEHAALMEFEDEAGLFDYQKDPSHVAVSGELRKRVSAIEVLDFVTED